MSCRPPSTNSSTLPITTLHQLLQPLPPSILSSSTFNNHQPSWFLHTDSHDGRMGGHLHPLPPLTRYATSSISLLILGFSCGSLARPMQDRLYTNLVREPPTLVNGLYHHRTSLHGSASMSDDRRGECSQHDLAANTTWANRN